MSVSTSIGLFFYKKVMLISSLILLVPWTLAADYCSLCSDHTMCMYNGISPTCGVLSEHGVSKTEARHIVNLHNIYRTTVAYGTEDQDDPRTQPPAANMRALIWDETLAEVAQKWAEQCTVQHDSCRNDPRFSVGQNIYWSTGYSEPDWDRAIQSWYSEMSMFNGQTVRNFEYGASTGCYTQMIWGKTRYVGCGRSSYGNFNPFMGSGPTEYNLSPAGNNSKAAPKKTKVHRKNLGLLGKLKPDPAATQGALTGFLGTGQPGVQKSQLKASDGMSLQQELLTLAGNKQFGFPGRQQLLVCNYGPAGNIYGDSVYQPGEPCSQCPSDTFCVFGLCA